MEKTDVEKEIEARKNLERAATTPPLETDETITDNRRPSESDEREKYINACMDRFISKENQRELYLPGHTSDVVVVQVRKNDDKAFKGMRETSAHSGSLEVLSVDPSSVSTHSSSAGSCFEYCGPPAGQRMK